MSVFRSIVVGLAVALFGLIGGLGLVEAGFRLHEYFNPPAGKGFFWVPSKSYGWGLAPSRSAPFYNDQQEFRTFVRINSKGQRDIEHEYNKPEGVYRILVLGDSYMEALQVDEEQIFARILEAQLNAGRGQSTIEVINTGVSAWGTDNQVLFFREEGYKYKPDLVLLSFTTANDIRENFLPFNRMAMGANLTKPHFSLAPDGQLRQHPPHHPPAAPLPWWREHLRVGNYLFQRLAGPQPMPRKFDVGIAPPADKTIPYVPADMLVYKPEPPEEVRQAFAVTEALLLALRDEVYSHGARFAVMVHNGPWVYDDDRWKFMCARNPRAYATWDKQKPNREIDRFLEENGIPYFDLFQAFHAAKGGEELFFKVDPHWRAPGHRLAASEAERFLRSAGLVPPIDSSVRRRATP